MSYQTYDIALQDSSATGIVKGYMKIEDLYDYPNIKLLFFVTTLVFILIALFKVVLNK